MLVIMILMFRIGSWDFREVKYLLTAHSCLEGEWGFELRQSCSRAHTQPPHKQEKSGHVCITLLFLLAWIAWQNWSFCFTYEKQHGIGIQRTGSGVSLPRLEYHLYPLVAVKTWESYLNSLCFGFLIIKMGIIIFHYITVKIKWEKKNIESF